MHTMEHKVKCVECAQKCLARFKAEGEETLDTIITGNGTWAHCYTPEKNKQSKLWQHTHSP